MQPVVVAESALDGFALPVDHPGRHHLGTAFEQLGDDGAAEDPGAAGDERDAVE
jgi:hypothetical protein